jgi:hypothetical protein
MNEQFFRKLTSRVLRHSGFTAKINRDTKEYELSDESGSGPILLCKPAIDTTNGESEYYLCFYLTRAFSPEQEKLYKRIINRFTRLAPSVNINLENLFDPIFTDEEMEKIQELVNEKGEDNEAKQNNNENPSI